MFLSHVGHAWPLDLDAGCTKPNIRIVSDQVNDLSRSPHTLRFILTLGEGRSIGCGQVAREVARENTVCNYYSSAAYVLHTGQQALALVYVCVTVVCGRGTCGLAAT